MIENNPTNSEFYRILGQILSEEGDQDEAINSLIDALRWDSKNSWALIMMGNIFAKFKGDIEVAMQYYDQALVAKPNDNIAINNIAANFLHQGKIEEAKKYFWKAIEINDTYPNTHFALGIIAIQENDLNSAFYSTIKSIQVNEKKDALYQNSISQAFEIAKALITSDAGKKTFRNYRHKLEFEGDKEIDIIEDENIATAAKIEFAENYNTEKHVIKFKRNNPAFEHLIMHELVHLDFVIQARKKGLNQLFISNQKNKSSFLKNIDSTIKKLQKKGYSEKTIEHFANGIFDGLNSQVFNTPIDLFIESFLHQDFEELRPFQFLSLYSIINDGINAVTNKEVIEISPVEILSVSKIYNLVNALLFKELFGIDLLDKFSASRLELKQAQEFYNEFLQYKDDKEEGEEYELVQHWADDLKLEKYFELVSENDFRANRMDINNLLNRIEKDPFNIESKDPFKEREMSKFQKSQQDLGTNMAVVMFMVEALVFFKKQSDSDIKKIAFEIAMYGTQGYRPDKNDYQLPSIPNKLFSGYQILAYYFVSWKLAIPEMVSQLQLPYEKEYELALTIQNSK